VIAELEIGGGPQIDVAEDPREPPHVLIFEIGAVGVFVDRECEGVFTLLEIGGEVEFRRGPRILGVADLDAVDVEVEGRIDAVEGDEGVAAVPVLWEREAAAVAADRIAEGGGSVGVVARRVAHDFGRVFFERVSGVFVDRRAEAVELPVRGHRQGGPAGGVEFRLFEALGDGRGRPGEMKFPGSVEPVSERLDGERAGSFRAVVEAQIPRRCFGALAEGGLARRERHAGGARGLFVDAEDRRILPDRRIGEGRGGEERKQGDGFHGHGAFDVATMAKKAPRIKAETRLSTSRF
jgi:hypothetical protein